METLKIEIPKGFEIDSFDKETGELTFKQKPVDVMDRIKTIDDVLKDNGVDEQTRSLTKVTLEDLGLQHMYWQWIAELIAKSLNEGWEPDWSNDNQCKYFPWFEMKGCSGFRFHVCAGWHAHMGVGSRLCLKSRLITEYAGKQFEHVYHNFMDIDRII